MKNFGLLFFQWVISSMPWQHPRQALEVKLWLLNHLFVRFSPVAAIRMLHHNRHTLIPQIRYLYFVSHGIISFYTLTSVWIYCSTLYTFGVDTQIDSTAKGWTCKSFSHNQCCLSITHLNFYPPPMQIGIFLFLLVPGIWRKHYLRYSKRDLLKYRRMQLQITVTS